MNILSGQLEYVPVLKNVQAIYSAHAGRVRLFGFFSPVQQPIMIEGVYRISLNQTITSSGTQQCPCRTTVILRTAPLTHSAGLSSGYIHCAKRPGNRIL